MQNGLLTNPPINILPSTKRYFYENILYLRVSLFIFAFSEHLVKLSMDMKDSYTKCPEEALKKIAKCAHRS